MRKGLIGLLLASLLGSCWTLSESTRKEEFFLMGLYDKGIVFLKDTDRDGELDRRFYYEMIGTEKGPVDREPKSGPSNMYYIFRYSGSEPYSPSHFHYPPSELFDLERSVAVRK